MYIAQGNYRDYISKANQPAILVRESSMQLLRYSLDTCVRYTTYFLISSLRKALNFLMDYLIITP